MYIPDDKEYDFLLAISRQQGDTQGNPPTNILRGERPTNILSSSSTEKIWSIDILSKFIPQMELLPIHNQDC